MGGRLSIPHLPPAIGGAARKSARADADQRKIAKDKKRKQSPDPIEEAYGDVGVLEPTAKAARFDPGGQVCPSSFAIPLLFMLFCGTNFVITAARCRETESALIFDVLRKMMPGVLPAVSLAWFLQVFHVDPANGLPMGSRSPKLAKIGPRRLYYGRI